MPRREHPERPDREKPRASFDLFNAGGRVDPTRLRAAAGLSATGEDEALAAQSVGDDAVDRESIAGGEDDAPTRVRFVLQRDINKRLDKYLTDRIPFMSRSQLQRLIDNEAVTINGKTPKASTAVRAGDVVEAMLPPPPPSEITPEEIPLDVLHEDADLIVLNKRADFIVHPARSHLKGTMVNALAWHFLRRSSIGGALSAVGGDVARPGVVHRLDRNTTGAIVFAKRDEAHWRLGHQFERRQVDKRYLAVVHGEMEPLADVIDLPLGNHPSREKGYREKYVVRHDEQGKEAVTIYRVRERYRGFTLVELELKTGRTHQIRVHLSHLGYPIVGDDMYGGKPLLLGDLAGPNAGDRRADPLISRQALHAATLGFRHPTTNHPMRFTAPAPPDLRALILALRRHRAAPTGSGTISPPGASIDVGTILGESDVSSPADPRHS